MTNKTNGHPFYKVESPEAPAAAGPYSPAVALPMGNGMQLLFLSGQIHRNPATGKLVTGDIKTMTRCVLDNLETLLKAAGSGFEHVVRVEIFLIDMASFSEMNEEYKLRFTGPCLPARQTVQVAKLPLNASIEISCIAVAPIKPPSDSTP